MGRSKLIRQQAAQDRPAPRTGSPQIEDVLRMHEAHERRVRAGAKARARSIKVEYVIRDLLREAYGIEAERAADGGGYGKRVKLDQQTVSVLSGDIAMTHARFTLEVKSGGEYHIETLFYTPEERGGQSMWRELHEHLEQVTGDARRAKRWPMLVWLMSNKPPLAFFQHDMWRCIGSFLEPLTCSHMQIHEPATGLWYVYPFKALIKAVPKSVMFDEQEAGA